jgi:uncharacterized protein YbbC (DUF1343 family)
MIKTTMGRRASKYIACIAMLCATNAVHARVVLGVDNFLRHYTGLIVNKRVGIITNQTGQTGDGRSTVSAIKLIPGVMVTAIFCPEHGLGGAKSAGEFITSYYDSSLGVQVYSLYGAHRKPTTEMLRGIEVLIYDIQDIGVRSYTYINTLGLAMQSAAENNISFIVLDRPTPLANRIDGNVLDTTNRSFVGMYPIPYVYGLTTGELARMINDEHLVGHTCELTIIPLLGWDRTISWTQTDLPWTPPSPNISAPYTSAYYAAFGLLGELGLGAFQGIGTPMAFQVFAFQNSRGKSLQSILLSSSIDGVRCIPYDTIIIRSNSPAHYIGVRFDLNLQSKNDLMLIGLKVLSVLLRNNIVSPPDSAHAAMFAKIVGNGILPLILGGIDIKDISRQWQPAISAYCIKRKLYLLY